MGYVLTSGDPVVAGAKVSDRQWDVIMNLTVEFGRPAVQLRGLPRSARVEGVEVPDQVALDIADALTEALEAGKPFPPGGDPDPDDPNVLTRDAVHRVRFVLRLGDVRLAWAPASHTGEDPPDDLLDPS
jgi:hypothetical protein